LDDTVLVISPKQDLSGSLHYLKEKEMDYYRKVKCPDCCWIQFLGWEGTVGMTPCDRCNSTGYIFKLVEDTEDYFRGREDGLMIKEFQTEPKGDDEGLLIDGDICFYSPKTQFTMGGIGITARTLKNSCLSNVSQKNIDSNIGELLKAQRDLTASIKDAECQERVEGIKRVVLRSIADEPEYPSDMPDELWRELDGNRINVSRAMQSTVRLTKDGITERLLQSLKEKE